MGFIILQTISVSNNYGWRISILIVLFLIVYLIIKLYQKLNK